MQRGPLGLMQGDCSIVIRLSVLGLQTFTLAGSLVLQRIPTAAIREPGHDADVVAGRADAVGQPKKSQTQGELHQVPLHRGSSLEITLSLVRRAPRRLLHQLLEDCTPEGDRALWTGPAGTR